jgi:hypothetical protein
MLCMGLCMPWHARPHVIAAPVQVRDALNLTYDVSFELSLFDRLGTGWFVCHVTSTPQRINEALEASLRVLRNFPMQRVTPRDLLRARNTVLTRHESDLKVLQRSILLISANWAATACV